MKRTNIYGIGLAIGLTITLSGCQSHQDDLPNASESIVPLEITTSEVGTRSIVGGSVLPDGCIYTVYAMNGFGDICLPGGDAAIVEFKDGTNRFIQPENGVMIPDNTNVPVYAFYPGDISHNLWNTYINAKYQQDFLWGWSSNSSGSLTYATATSPKVNLRFEHVLARITVNFLLREDNPNSYKFSPTLGGDGQGTYRSAYLNLMERVIYEESYGEYEEIKGEVKDGVNVLGGEDRTDMVTCDFLVIPSKYAAWQIHQTIGTRTWFDLPAREYQSGKQYIYNVIIGNGDFLEISNVKIQPWDNNNMSEVEIW